MVEKGGGGVINKEYGGGETKIGRRKKRCKRREKGKWKGELRTKLSL